MNNTELKQKVHSAVYSTLKELWPREYDEVLKKGVKPREALRKTYKYILENDKLPEYFLH